MATDETAFPRTTQRPAGAGAGLPRSVSARVAEVNAAYDGRDGQGALRALRRLVAETAGRAELRWLWAAAQQDLGDALAELGSGDPDGNLEEVIDAYRAAAEVYSATVCPVEYGKIQNNLGAAYLNRRRGAPGENPELAIAALGEALTVRTREADPYGWARAQNNLGNAYMERRQGDPAGNQRIAIAAYQAALEIHDVLRYPRDHSMDEMNLGLAYQAAVDGDRVANLDRAMCCFLRALLPVPPRPGRGPYRGLILSLSDAFHDRLDATPEPQRAEVARRLGPVVETLTSAAMYAGIRADPDQRPARPSGDAAPVLDGRESWLPEPGLFAGYLHDRYRIIPLPDLIGMISADHAGQDPALRVAMLRAAVDRDDVVLPKFRADLLRLLASALVSLDADRADASVGTGGGRPLDSGAYGTAADDIGERGVGAHDVGADGVGERPVGASGVGAHEEEAITALLAAAAAYDRRDQAGEWAAVQQDLAGLFARRLAGDRAENAERAIDHVRATLEVHAPGSPDWALANGLLGQLYRDRRLGDREHNDTAAVEAFGRALTVWTRDRHPYEWARALNSLGLTYLDMPRGHREAIEAAIQAFTDALTVLTREAHPYEWAGVRNNLGRAYDQRHGPGDVERAIACFTETLSVHTRQEAPGDWAHTQHNLGQLYGQSRDRPGDLDTAARHFRAALEVLTLRGRTADHRSTAGALGMVEARRGDWQAAHEAFAAACVAGDLLLAGVSTGLHGHDDVQRGGHDAGELDAYALARLGRLDEAVETVERGRARSLVESMAIQSADPDRIGDADRRTRYRAAREALLAAQAAANAVTWRTTGEAERAPALAATRALAGARHGFDEVVAEIRRQRDPADFLDPSLTAAQIAAGADHAVVYLLSTPWGGLALAVRPGDRPGAVLALDLPDLTDALVGGLIQVMLDDGRLVGGYAAAQEGLGLNWLANQWPGDTFADKAGALHEACRGGGVPATLDAAAQQVVALTHPGLPEILHARLAGLDDAEVARLAATLSHAFLRAELARCLPRLAGVALRRLTGWLLEQGIPEATLVPCGMLPALPLTAAPVGPGGPLPAERWATMADRLRLSVAPNARSVLRRPAGSRTRSGLYALGDPRPTHQALRWGEAEALAVAAIAGQPGNARVKEAATRDWLVTGLRDGEVVTASCHGQFDGRDILRSRLLLAGGATLTIGEAVSNQVDLAGLRLLVLSACQTAVTDVRGARGESRSLAVAMLQAGARAVLGSLWAVDDRATYLLMARFAREWLPVMDHEDPAPALARAQRWLRTVTHRELADAEPVAGAEPPGRGPLLAVRGRGDRYSMAEAEQLIAGLAARRAGEDGDGTPYADPIFWAGFQVTGR